MDYELGDPSLASALNNRYNGSLAQHQAAVYDGGALPQPGSPVPQVYTSSCKPEGYWHQGAEYNVNPVSQNSYFIFSFVFMKMLKKRERHIENATASTY